MSNPPPSLTRTTSFPPPNFTLKRQGDKITSESSNSNKELSSSSSSISTGTNQSIAYAHFSLNIQQEVRDELPSGANIDEIARRIESRWSSLPTKEKKYWKRASCSSSLKSKQNMAGAIPNSNGSGQQLRGSPQKKSAVATASSLMKHKPKRPLSAYFYFEKEMRPKVKAEFPNLGGNDVTKRIALMWNQWSEKDKKYYLLLEAKGRQEYSQALLEWKSSLQANATHDERGTVNTTSKAANYSNSTMKGGRKPKSHDDHI